MGPDEQLEEAEALMFRRVLAGEEFDPGPTSLAATADWGVNRTIRAAILGRLFDDHSLPAKGVRLSNVRISGQLDLKSATLRRPLELKNCWFDSPGPVILDYAKVTLLVLEGCQLPGLTGNTLVVAKGLELTRSEFTGPVMLPDARIHGHFRATGAQLTKANCEPAAMEEYGGSYALVGDGMKVSGDVRLDGTFTAAGVLLSGAHIGGTLDCTGARLLSAEQVNADNKNYCLRGSGLEVDGDLIFDKCTAEGNGIRLSDAHIAGELLCHGTRLYGADNGGNALRANDLKVGSNVLFLNGFTADGGKISLKQAVIGGNLDIEPKRLGADSDGVAFDAAGTQVAQRLIWRPEAQVRGKVILGRVSAGQLEDSWAGKDGRERPNGYWPANGRLDLVGLTYNSIRSVPYDDKVGVDKRLEWIRSQYNTKKTRWQRSPANSPVLEPIQPDDNGAPQAGRPAFATQPYRQLANVYLGAGRNADARTIAIAQRRDLRSFGRLTKPAKVGNWLLDNTIRYGYRTWHAAIALALLYAAVTAFFWFGSSYHDAVIAVQPPAGYTVASLNPAHCNGVYPCFNPFGYAVDTVIPIINVHQADFWAPNAHASSPWGWLSVVITYLSTGLGWLFATLAVAGYTGLARNASSP
jgi:uncharacterized protein YjbI with pentapeptide repeats